MSTKQTVESKTTIPEPSAEEKEIMKMISGPLMETALKAQGVEVTRTEKTFEQTNEYQSYQDRRSRLTEERNELVNQMEGLKTSTQKAGYFYNQGEMNKYQQRINEVNRKLDSLDAEETNARDNYDPIVEFTTRELDPPEVERARKLYGEDSEQYKSLKDEYDLKEIESSKTQDQIFKSAQEATLKYLNGDFSITEEQKRQISDNLAPYREAVQKMYSEAEKDADETERSLAQITMDKYKNFRDQVAKTKMDTMAALETVGSQIMQTGDSMEDALAKTVSANQALLEMGIEDYTGQVTRNIASKAAMVGRSPSDPEYQNEIAENIAREVKMGQLNLAAMESQGILSIKERTGSALERLGLTKADLIAQTGAKLESASLEEGAQKGAIAEKYGDYRGSLRMGANQAASQIEQEAANIRWQVGAGMPPGQVQLGLGTHQYQEALNQQGIQNAMGAMQTPMGVVDYYRGERHAQPTTTQTTTTSGIGTWLSPIMAGAGAAANAYSGFSSASALRGLAGQIK